MTIPLKIDTSTSPVSLKQFAGADYDYVVHQILNEFVTLSTGTGTIIVDPVSTTGLTLIGSFVDTARPYNSGVHPAGTDIISQTYNFYQDLRTVSETTLIRPIKIANTSSLQEQSDSDINSSIITAALSNLVANGIGCYALSVTTPVGGTWVAESTITNTTNSSVSDATYVWRKTANSAPGTTVRTLKIDSSTSPASLKEMTDSEIKTLTARLRNQISSTGIGKYKVSSSAPSDPGTWISNGNAFTDNRNQIASQSYTGNYIGSYLGSYSAPYSGSYTGNYSRAFTGAFSGSYLGAIFYAGVPSPFAYSGFYTRNFSSTYSSAYIGAYAGAFQGNFSGSYSGSYSGLTIQSTNESVSTANLWLRIA
jgi:hypothetical protein